MASITLQNVSKTYGKASAQVTALDNISFDIQDKEFVVVFGPAGAGKTTLLSVISGILRCNAGSILFDGQAMDGIRPAQRNVAMVFENYALYPHLTVYDNIAFPLRSPRYRQDEATIKRRIDEITAKMNIAHLHQRLPSQVSNGQRQRIALGRALVRNPKVFLMDEPLAHLDAKLKNSMRTELKAVQQQLNTTAIYVTHDYLEALSLADKIIILHNGSILQIGTPDEIYHTPSNTFVAKLVGEPEINLFACTFDEQYIYLPSEKADLGMTGMNLQLAAAKHPQLAEKCPDHRLICGIRGIDIAVSFEPKDSKDPNKQYCQYCKGEIIDFYSIGNKFVITVQSQGNAFRTLVPGSTDLKIGMTTYICIDPDMILFFDAKSEKLLATNR